MRRQLLPFLALLLVPTLALADGYRVTWDDFKDGEFSVGAADSKWFYFNLGPAFVGDDGIATTSPQGLRVVSPGINATTGEPAFTSTVAPESQSWLPGGIDHVKWLVYMNHLASTGVPGHDAETDKVLSCEAWMGGRTYGTEQHPFGTLIENDQDDLRLAAVALNTVDFESFMVFDFFMTNETIYAVYERLPFARGYLGNYASFTHQIPLAKRTTNDFHHLKLSYDRGAGTMTWYIDDVQVFQVDKIGHRLDDRSLITLDHGGENETVDMRQLSCGMGQFTLLDAYLPSEIGLVRLSEVPYFYFDPSEGEPTPAPFYDDYSAESNRIWGQGAELTVKKYVVSSKPRE